MAWTSISTSFCTIATEGTAKFIDTWAQMASRARYAFLRINSAYVAVGVYFDGNPDTLNWWVWNSGMNGRACTFDFGTRFTLRDMCNNGGRWNMAQLDHAGFIGRDPIHAVSFLENHDTDLNSP